MGMTTSSYIFICGLDVAREVAEEWLGLRQYLTENWCDKEDNPRLETAGYYMWQDRQLLGGACRITWKDGLTWVSRHSGYPQADMTADACEVFGLLGAKGYPGHRPVPGSIEA